MTSLRNPVPDVRRAGRPPLRRAGVLPGRTHHRRRAGHDRRGGSRSDGHDHQPGDRRRPDGDLRRRRQLLRHPPPRHVLGVGCAQGLRPADAPGRQARRGGHPALGLRAGGAAGRGGHGHGHAARADRGRRALLRRRAHRGRAAQARASTTSRAWPRTSPASPCRTSDPARARSPCAASPPARSCATSRASRSRSASTSTSRSSRSRCSRPTSTCSTSAASRCCADRRARCSAPARSPAPCATSRNQPELGVTRVVRRAGRQHGRAAAAWAATPRSAFNVPLGDKAALRVAALLQPHRAATSTPCSPTSASTRTSTAATAPACARRSSSRRTTSLTITPRIVYQKVEMDGWNRIDAFNILANPFTTTRPAGDARRARAVHADRGAVHRRVPARRPEPQLRLRRRRPDLDHLLHRPRRPGRPRRDRADRQHHRRHHRPAARTSTRSTRRSTTPPRRRCGRRSSASPAATDRLQWVAGGFYSDTRPRLRPEPAGDRLRGAHRHPHRRASRAPQDVLFFSDLGYDLKQFALFGEGTCPVSDQLDLTGGLRYYDFNEDKRADLRRHLRQRQQRHAAGVAARLDRRRRLRAAPHRQLQG